jgi:mRNA-degrading endonuclease RelE of RelBE toxin-antitoxin system
MKPLESCSAEKHFQWKASFDLALTVRLSQKAAKYIGALDAPTKKRITERLKEICEDPLNLRLSKPLTGTNKRSTRIGPYRILILIAGEVLLVSDAGPRGQIYKRM